MARRGAEAVESGQHVRRVKPDLRRGHVGMPVFGLGVTQGKAVEQQAVLLKGLPRTERSACGPPAPWSRTVRPGTSLSSEGLGRTTGDSGVASTWITQSDSVGAGTGCAAEEAVSSKPAAVRPAGRTRRRKFMRRASVKPLVSIVNR
jgi:hypothetical protein